MSLQHLHFFFMFPLQLQHFVPDDPKECLIGGGAHLVVPDVVERCVIVWVVVVGVDAFHGVAVATVLLPGVADEEDVD